jgi:predicted pyridoxine 5'-phosphate oxidase superfamily flavin-nucleotide-binding protein
MSTIATIEQLEAIYGEPNEASTVKVADRITPPYRVLIDKSPFAAPSVKINTSATSNMVWTQMQLQRWNGASWDQVGDVLDAALE